ncbi:MAG: amino acid permease, partial [Actinomycetota bacterium]|nr:amino acid permease [Actinomycetota bacterium]
LASSPAPLATAVEGGRLAVLLPAVRIGATVASLGVLLSLTVGVSRTTFAMARNGELPRYLAAVHPRNKVPHLAEATVAVLVVALVLVVDLRGAIGFSSFTVLGYYAIANASAWTLPDDQRRWPRWIAALGLAGCAALALSLPLPSVVSGAGILALAAAVWLLRREGRTSTG